MIPLFKVRMEETAIEKANEVLRSGFIGQGKVVDEFEEYLKDYFKHKYVLTMNAATNAEYLAFYMMKREYEGCEVLCTPLTCTATNWPVVLNGYKIKWVDVDPETCNMDLDDLLRKISVNTKIIYIVHWGGYPIDYDKLASILIKCERMYGFRPEVVEDCAHAMGSSFEAFKLGNVINSWATYSLQAIKHVTSIDGGVLLCPNEESYKRAKLLRWYGIDREGNKKDFRCEENIAEAGFKFHMNDVCAAIGMENLKTSDKYIDRNRECAEVYCERFKDNKRIKIIPYNEHCSYWIYTMFVEDSFNFMKKMKENGIHASRVHKRNDVHSCVKDYRVYLPGVDNCEKTMVCIPCGWWVSHEDLEYIIEVVNSGW